MNKNVALMIVPTGIGASIGGYAGDASKYAQKVARNMTLIVNPNTVNAAVFSGITDNMLYVEGWAIEQFVKGNIGLLPSQNNKIGIIFDKAIPQEVLNIHINTINAIKTVYDIDIIGYEITKENSGVEFFNNENGISTGNLKNPTTLKETAKKLLEKGANALAIVCYFEEPPEDDYENGEGVDIVGGIEAIISHYLTKELLCPCVHAPAFADTQITNKIVNPKVSAEYITPTFLPCLMFGLKNAPLLVKLNSENTEHPNFVSPSLQSKHNQQLQTNLITNKNLHSIAVPHNSVGSSIVLDAIKNNIPVFAIKENSTVLDVNGYSIGKQNDIVELATYQEYSQLLIKEQ